MKKIDRKIIVKSYEYFEKNGQLFLRPRSLQNDLKIDENTVNKSIERLEKLGYIEFNDKASAGILYQLSNKGIEFAQQNMKSFLEKVIKNKVLQGVFGFIVSYLLGLYTEEIKAFINQLF